MQADTKQTIEEAHEQYLKDCQARGLSEGTIRSYDNHFRCIKQFLNTEMPFEKLTRKDTEDMTAKMREHGLARNTVASYIRAIKCFLTWANQQGLTTVTVPAYKQEETIKETYTDEELERLLKKPNLKNCEFREYRDWVIINLLVNSGCRAGSIRNIQNRDVDLANSIIYLRHTKNSKVLVLPLCSVMVGVLREYMSKRKGGAEDYLFCTEYGDQLTEAGLRTAIVRYNRRRGVEKTSIHLFRHTFARKYLVDCGGNAFTLQKLLGHSTLEMTKHYCQIFNKDIIKDYDNFSPLSQFSKRKISIH